MGPAPTEPHPSVRRPERGRGALPARDPRPRALGGTPTQAEVARSVGVAAPTALEMIRRLRGLGFVAPDAIALTHAGQSAALVLSSRRAAAHALVHDVLGIDDELSRREADHLATARLALARAAAARRPRAPAQAAALGEEALPQVPAAAARRAGRRTARCPCAGCTR